MSTAQYDDFEEHESAPRHSASDAWSALVVGALLSLDDDMSDAMTCDTQGTRA